VKMAAARAARTTAMEKRDVEAAKKADVHEYFWSVKLDEKSPSHQWVMDPEVEGEEDDEDFMNHTLQVKTVVLGEGVAEGQSHVVMLKSEGQDGEIVEAAVAHLQLGHGAPMSTCNISIDGRVGGTFTLAHGAGPLWLTGTYRRDYPSEEHLVADDPAMISMTDAEDLDDTANTEDGDDSEEEEEEEETEETEEEETKPAKGKKTAVKRKASMTKETKNKKMKKDDTEEEEEDEEMDEDEEEEEEEEKPAKQVKKTAKEVKGTKATTGKTKTPEVKKGKKAGKAK